MKRRIAATKGERHQVSLRGATCMVALAAAAAFGTTFAAHAQEQRDGAAGPQQARRAQRAGEVGHATRAWFDLQRGNTAAAPAQPMLGAEASLAYERYLNSFRTKIPDSFGSAMQADGGALHGGYPNLGSSGSAQAGQN